MKHPALAISFAFIFIATTFPALTLSAQTQTAEYAENFDAAHQLGQQTERPFAVLVHGASWHPASQRFLDQVWKSDELLGQIEMPMILADIHIRQSLSKEQQEADRVNRQNWDEKKIKTYPTLQFYSHDGKLLKQYLGREFRELNTQQALATCVNEFLELNQSRKEISQQLLQAEKNNDTGLQIRLLIQRLELPLDIDKESVAAQLEKVDPQDTSGWRRRLTLDGWQYLRQVSRLIAEEKIDEALEETEAKLDQEGYTPQQRALLLGAKGRILVAQEKLVEAWEVFQLAHAADPEGPAGKSMLRYGAMAALAPTRSGVGPDSDLFGKSIGENLTRDHATFSLSSDSKHNSDDRAASLFNGPYHPSGWAFHTSLDETTPHVIVDLQAECTLRAIQITNRRGFEQRAATLRVEVSSDQQTWTEIWQADEAKHAWSIELSDAPTARYLKFSLNAAEPTPLHLVAIDIFGDRKRF